MAGHSKQSRVPGFPCYGRPVTRCPELQTGRSSHQGAVGGKGSQLEVTPMASPSTVEDSHPVTVSAPSHLHAHRGRLHLPGALASYKPLQNLSCLSKHRSPSLLHSGKAHGSCSSAAATDAGHSATPGLPYLSGGSSAAPPGPSPQGHTAVLEAPGPVAHRPPWP